MRNSYDLSRPVLPDFPRIGQPVSAELCRAISTLAFFAAGAVGRDPHLLTLADLCNGIQNPSEPKGRDA